MSITVPETWEIMRHSVQEARGQLAWCDRRHQRLLLSWSTCATRPDVQRLFSDYKARDSEAERKSRFHDLAQVDGWTGYRRRSSSAGAVRLTRAGRYEPVLKRWIELTIPWEVPHDGELEAELLAGFSVGNGTDSAAASVGREVWQAFGLRVEAPRDMKLVHVEPKPADLRVTFRRGRDEAVVRRLGMLRAWFNGDLTAWLEKEADKCPGILDACSPPGNALCDTEPAATSAVTFAGWEAGPRWRSLLGLRRERLDRAWVCPSSQTICHVMTLSFPGQPLRPEDFAVSCSAFKGH